MGVVYLTANQTIASRAVFQLSLTNPTMSIARTPGFSLFFPLLAPSLASALMLRAANRSLISPRFDLMQRGPLGAD